MLPTDPAHLESRFQETEIKLAFLEKELEEYKTALQAMHARLESVETKLKNTAASESPMPDHFAS
jgi:uncharacterized coiled-coil protein SlyX